MKKKFVYDLPTRVFHWSFATLFIAAFVITKILGKKSPFFEYHMLIGILMSIAVFFRLVWALIGNSYASFNSFNFETSELLSYFKDLFTSKTKRYLGHNPASSWATAIMLGSTLGLALSGYMVVQGNEKEVYADIHEFFAYVFISTVVLHILGLMIHTLRHKDRIVMSIISGFKVSEGIGESGVEKKYRLVGFLLFLGLLLFAFYLYKNYDSQTHSLNLFGQNFILSDK